MTLHSFDCPDDLWNQFLKAIESEYSNISEAIRDLMRQKIRQKKTERGGNPKKETSK